jgi:AhpD family alkylhydroperoxidase
MNTNYIELREYLDKRLGELGKEIPGPMTGFSRLHKKALGEGELPARIKEMMALAISIVVQCEGCIAYHTANAVKAGAGREELLETIAVAILMGGGPASIYAVQAYDAVDQFLGKVEAP